METGNLDVERKARDAGIAQVTANNPDWMERALALLPSMKTEGYTTVTGEQIRFWLTSANVIPEKPQAWGALTHWACKRGILRDTGRVSHMKANGSHARRTPIWEFL